MVCFEETAEVFCDTIYVIEDNYGSISNILLSNIKDNLLRLGADVISCWGPLFPEDKLEQCYIQSMNFKEVDQYVEKIIQELLP